MIKLLKNHNNRQLNNHISFPVGLDVTWTSPEEQAVPDPYLKNWLLDTGSLTERLQSQCRHFDLQLIGQQEIVMSEREAEHLGASPGDTGWQAREVLLKGEGACWVFARSLIPNALCNGDLAELGTKPLGQIIFNDNRFAREPFQICHLGEPQWLLQKISVKGKQPLWGRRSVFAYQHHKMSVAEVFLPDAPAYRQIVNYIHDNP